MILWQTFLYAAFTAVCETKLYVPMPWLPLTNPLWWHCLASHHSKHVCSCSNLQHGHISLLLYQAIHKCHTTVCRSAQWPATVPPINQPATVQHCDIFHTFATPEPQTSCSWQQTVAAIMPCAWTWSLHKAPHKIMFSDRIQFIAETKLSVL